MQPLHYCITTGIAILLLVGCLLHLRENDTFSVEAVKKFRRLIYVLSLEIILDTIFALLVGQEIAVWLLYATKTTELLIAPVVAFLVFDIFYGTKTNSKDKSMKNMRKAMIAAVIFNTALQLTSLLGGFVYYIDAANIYHRGPLAFVYIINLAFAICVLVCEIAVFSNKTQSIMKLTLAAFTITLVTGVTLRILFADTNYDSLCMSVAMMFLLMYYSHVTLRVDPLTHLLSRLVYQRSLKKISYTTIIIIVDVNDLKLINDTFGHKCGDYTLKQIAHLMYKAYGKYAYCFRIGGDEFCAILKPKVFDELLEKTPHCDVYSMAENFTKRLDDQIETQRENNDSSYSYLRFGVSQGYGVFYAEDGYSSDSRKMSPENVAELADKMMYDNKNQFRKNNPELLKIARADFKRAKVLYTPSTLELASRDEPQV